MKERNYRDPVSTVVLGAVFELEPGRETTVSLVHEAIGKQYSA